MDNSHKKTFLQDNQDNIEQNKQSEDFTNLHNFEIKNQPENDETEKKSRKTYKHKTISEVINISIKYPIFFSVTEAARLGGVQAKTIRRAIQSRLIIYKIIKNRYLIDLGSLIKFLHTKTKLRNKLQQFGIGQYIDKWKK
jgi:hypothetical protein